MATNRGAVVVAVLAPVVVAAGVFILTWSGSATAQDSDTFVIEPVLPDELFDYDGIEFPAHYLLNAFSDSSQSAAVDNDNTPEDNPITDAGATLGRVLFYDKTLSATGTVSCASCHAQDAGFSDPDPRSEGFRGLVTRRHSMSLVNARFYEPGRFFWNERARTLEVQVLLPFEDGVEMGLRLEFLVAIIDSLRYYEPLFVDAFGDAEVTTERISKALAQFVRSIVSVNSPYDQGRELVSSPLDDFPDFTEQENFGKSLFLTGGARREMACADCHVSEAFVNTPRGPTNNGLDPESTIDLGANEATGDPDDVGAFKVPSLRDVARSAPYMHDARFATLEDVVGHYSEGVQGHPTLSAPLTGVEGMPAQFDFRADEQAALVAFLHTLTDEDLATSEKFSDPFQTVLFVPDPSPTRTRSTTPAEPVADDVAGAPLSEPRDGSTRTGLLIAATAVVLLIAVFAAVRWRRRW